MKKKIITFNEIIARFNKFWQNQSCTLLQPIDQEVGAATFHPMTFINAINKKPFNAAYTQISKRPSDIRHTSTSNRSIMFHQYQVIMKPSPTNIQELYLNSLEYIGINKKINEINFIEDNWQSPSLGAHGIGWEVRLNGTEITQFTYFQQMGDAECKPIMVEIAYGLERIAMHVQSKIKIHDIILDIKKKHIKYSDIFLNYETELSKYIENELKINDLLTSFNKIELDCKKLIEHNLPLIAYDHVIKLSHIFNLIDAKTYISITERHTYISRIRTLSKKIADSIKND